MPFRSIVPPGLRARSTHPPPALAEPGFNENRSYPAAITVDADRAASGATAHEEAPEVAPQAVGLKVATPGNLRESRTRLARDGAEAVHLCDVVLPWTLWRRMRMTAEE